MVRKSGPYSPIIWAVWSENLGRMVWAVWSLIHKMSTLDMNGDVNTDYEKFSNVLLNLTDKHAPLKQKKMLHKPVPFMTKTLKQAIYQKRMLLNKYNKYKNAKNWDKYRKQRNLVTSLRRKYLNKYFLDRCIGGCQSKDVWPTVKPFLTNKGSIIHKDTILYENANLVNDQTEVSEIFNDFFVNVAKNIGNDAVQIDSSHPSITKIEENISSSVKFDFKPVNEEFINKQIDKLGTKKATGHDRIPSKIVKNN